MQIYLSRWHVRISPAIIDSIVKPLQDYTKISLFEYEGQNQPLAQFDESIPALFCVVMPPREVLRNSKVRLIWAPMVDWVWDYSQAWWCCLPRTMKVIAFSDVIARRCKLAGLPHISIRYFKNPTDFEPARWPKSKVLFYWNRTDLYPLTFIEKLCKALRIDLMLLREEPITEKHDNLYRFPDRIGATTVRKIPGFMSQGEYQKVINEANIFLAPRAIEGIGMLFIESLARGCAVFACNASTMNEYICHTRDGYLWHTRQQLSAGSISPHFSLLYRKVGVGSTAAVLRLAVRLEQGLKSKLIRRHSILPAPSEFQDWDNIARLNLESIGQAARKNHFEGFAEWSRRIGELVSFVNTW